MVITRRRRHYLVTPATGDEALLDALAGHPVVLNRPFVVTPRGARLCRPVELVHEIL